MQDSIFTKIIKGEVPGHKVYEDDRVVAILDIHPIRPGHVLVIPKVQVDHFDDLTNEDYQAVFEVVQKVAKRLKGVMSAKRACLRIEGFDVPHAHIHVIPCDIPEDFYNSERLRIEPDHSALAEMARRLAF